MKKRMRVHSWRENYTPAIAPWNVRRRVLLDILSVAPGYGWRGKWLWGSRQWKIDLEQLIKEGLAVRTFKGGPKLCVNTSVSWYRADGVPVYRHRSNRSKHTKAVVLTDAGRALLPVQPIAKSPEPYAKRKALIAEFKEANA